VTESEWLASTDPTAMLEFLRNSGKASERKLRLFAVACCRRIWHAMTDERFRAAVAVAEQFGEGTATREELAAGEASSWDAAFDTRHMRQSWR
jgi:hypothetical protein